MFFITLVPFYPIFVYLLAHEHRWKRSFVWQKRWGKVLRFFIGVRLEIEGKENLPKAPYIIVSNHASYIDTFLMYGIIPEFFVFMGMADLKKLPMFGRFFSSGQNIAVNRSSAIASVKAFKEAELKIKKGYSVALFPEGGIKKMVPELSPFKNGAFKLALNTQVKLVPMLMFDTHILLESNNVFKTTGRPGVAKVKILKPVSTMNHPKEELISLRQQIHQSMQQELRGYYEKIKK